MANYLNKWTTTFLALLISFILLVYSNTLHAPFNFDDEAVVKFETKDVHHNLSRALTSANGPSITEILYHYSYPPRYRHLFYASLLLNYSQGKLNPFGYHLTNIFFHIIIGILRILLFY